MAMTHRLLVPLLAAAAALAAQQAQAQVPFPANRAGPYTAPAYSPYLNLLRGGNPAVNYYGIVRPQIAFNNAVQGLQQQINTVAAQSYAPTTTDAGLPMTGHAASYMNYSHFFPGLTGVAGRPVAPAGAVTRPITRPTAPTPAPRTGGGTRGR
jgi:hypothetical protein